MAGIRDTVDSKAARLPHVSRRTLLVGATAAGGLALAWSVWPRDYQPNLTAAPGEHIFNAFLKIGDDGHVKVEMTLTTPSCPSAQELPSQVEEAVRAVPGVTDAQVEVVWDPPWDQSRMSEDARLALNMF